MTYPTLFSLLEEKLEARNTDLADLRAWLAGLPDGTLFRLTSRENGRFDFEPMCTEAELEHRCDQRDAALESCGLLSSEVERLTTLALADKNTANIWRANAKKAEAEVERGEPYIKLLLGEIRALTGRAEKAEAELDAAIHRYAVAEDELSCANSKNAELKAELEMARPLVEAALHPEWPIMMYQNNNLTRAAKAYRAAKGDRP